MKRELLLLLSFIYWSSACPCPDYRLEKNKRHSKDCHKCTECTDFNYNPDNRNAEAWCRAPVCGLIPTGIKSCFVTYYGLCGFVKCQGSKGKLISTTSECPCPKHIETDSMKCCPKTCPHLNPNTVIHDAECANVYCGKDGRTYRGACALSDCGKTVSTIKVENYRRLHHFSENCM